jgi:hypothetical protein
MNMTANSQNMPLTIESTDSLECLVDGEIFCGDCESCIAWDATADIEGYEDLKRKRIAEQNGY